ncbi:EAL domain-containing protein [Lachnospiraceae bacterium 38-14]|nr:EAL domain-containing protein [Lachnospiraceae bacterium]
MKYIIHYDIAAIFVVLAAMVHFFYKKTISTRQTRIFTLLILAAIVSNIADLISIYLIENPREVPLWLHFTVNEIYLITFNATAAVYYGYIIGVTRGRERISKWEMTRILLPISIDIVLVLSTPFTQAVFYFDSGKNYLHGRLFMVLYAFALFYVLASLVHTIRYRKTMTLLQNATVYFYTISSFGAVILQIYFSNLMVAQFAVAISVLLIYLSLENPSDYGDKILGVYNALAFHEVVSSYIEKDKDFRVAGIQIEGLRYVGEMLGVKNQQQVVKSIAAFFVQAAGSRRVFALTDTRFAIVEKKKALDWSGLIEEIQGRFQKPFSSQGVEIALTAPVCIIDLPKSVQKLEDVTDILNYCFEEKGRGSREEVIYAGEELLKQGKRENRILQILSQAIREHLFQVYYQPIFSVEKQRFTSAEALLRLSYGDMGFISPEEFIPVAEKNGLILEIGDYVFREVCHFMTEQKIWELGIETIHINLSVVQCMQEQLYEQLVRIMDEYQVDYFRVHLEITETAAVVSEDTLWANMQRLIDVGVEFALDDYGTGFSNTMAVIKYPFRTIKLDKSMVWDSMKNKKAMSVLKHSISMIKDMNMDVVAEGVEEQEQAHKLAEMGCDYFQGYYYSKPVCGEAFVEKVRAQ